MSGTIANLNAALNGLRFTPGANFSGAAALTLATNDGGNTGAGGAKTAVSVVPVTVNVLPRTLSINNVSTLEGDSGVTPLTFTVTLSSPSTVPVSAQFATAPNTATAGVDYLNASGTVTFAPGETTKAIAVSVVGDTIQENNESFLVLLSNATGGVAISANTGTGTIIDDDGPPALAVSDASLTEGNSGTTNMTFTVTLTAPSGKTVSVDYATANGTATAGSDYTSVAGTLTFAPGQTSRIISVPIIGDTIVEPNETLLAQLSNAVGAPIARSQGTGTIINDDQATPTPAVQVQFDDVATGEIYRSLPVLVGSVTLTNAAPGSTLSVGVNVQRMSDGKYFNGSAWSATPTFLPTIVGNGTFSLPAGSLPANSANGQLLLDGKYNLTAVATDTAGHSANTTITLIIDHTPPTVTLTTPPAKSLLSALPTLAGKAADTPGGTGLKQVVVFIVRITDGKYFDGKSFVTPSKVNGVPQPSVLAIGYDPKSGNWARRSGLPTSQDLTPGLYRVVAIAIDKAGNRSEAMSSFSVKSSAPVPAASTVALSHASASAATSSVQLRFLAALDAVGAGDAEHYVARVNGKTVAVTGAGYDGSKHSVTLSLPEGSVSPGDKIVLRWSGLQDEQGRTVEGETTVSVAP